MNYIKKNYELMPAVSESYVIGVAKSSGYDWANHRVIDRVCGRGCFPLVKPEYRHLYESR